MADTSLQYFRNDAGVDTIQVGTSRFMCTGASAPFDHPHIYLDMGDDNTIVCPYCSTRYTRNAAFSTSEVRPPESAYSPGETV